MAKRGLEIVASQKIVDPDVVYLAELLTDLKLPVDRLGAPSVAQLAVVRPPELSGVERLLSPGDLRSLRRRFANHDERIIGFVRHAAREVVGQAQVDQRLAPGEELESVEVQVAGCIAYFLSLSEDAFDEWSASSGRA